jgi:ElaA protein
MEGFQLLAFNKLTTSELYSIIALREMVFVVEQNCPYLDADGKDKDSFHMMLNQEKRIVAYCRIVPPGVSYSTWSIGRVVVHPEKRGKGLGKLIMKKALEWIDSEYEGASIILSAQSYLKNFYEEMGFESTGDFYLEDGIPHMKMVRYLNRK